jgi:hypothetical protein
MSPNHRVNTFDRLFRPAWVRRKRLEHLKEVRRQAAQIRTSGLVNPAPASVMAAIRKEQAIRRKHNRMRNALIVVAAVILLVLFWQWFVMAVQSAAAE